MRHFVVYHHPDRMPYPVTQIESTRAYSDKDAFKVVNARVWVVGGMDHPRVYYLGSTFVCETIGRGEFGFKTKMLGSQGHTFGNRVEISEEPWFQTLRRVMGNFAFGLTEVTDHDVIIGLIDVASMDGYKVEP